jgi:hypothetical protein
VTPAPSTGNAEKSRFQGQTRHQRSAGWRIEEIPVPHIEKVPIGELLSIEFGALQSAPALLTDKYGIANDLTGTSFIWEKK